MITARVVGRARPLVSMLAIVALSMAMLPAASVSAQSTLDKAYATLRKVPGLKAQIPNLQVTANATEAVEWAAVGEVVLNKQLRNWFKPLVNGKLGWGDLPKAGAPVLATFVGLVEKASLKGPSSVVVHQGYSDGSKVVTQGSEANPFEADQTVDSFGLWFREGTGFYPQAASSSVGASGPNWYDLQYKGAGGIDKRMMANVVPIPKQGSGGGGGGGGGNPPPGGGGNPPPGGGGNPPPGGGGNPPGGNGNGNGNGDGDGEGDGADEPAPEPGAPNVHVAVEAAEDGDPAKRKLGDLVWRAGTYDLRRDFAPGGDPTTCVSVLGTQAVDSFGIVEINIQSLVPYDVEMLEEVVWLQAFDADGNYLGTFDAKWTSYTPTGPYQGGFIYQGFAELPYTETPIASVRLAPHSDFQEAVLASNGEVAADPEVALGQVAYAATPNRVAVPGRDGVIPCGTLESDDLDVCSDEIVSSMGAHASATEAGSEGGGGTVTGTPALGNKDSKECHGMKGGKLSQILGFSGEPSTPEKVEEVARIPGCPTTRLEQLQGDFVAVFCEAFTLYLWLQALPVPVEIAGESEARLDMLVSWAHFRAADERGPILDEDTDPLSIPSDVTIAAVQQMQDAVEAAASQAAWELAVPSGNA